VSLSPFRIAECTIGTGGLCGSIFIDDAFVRFLRHRRGGHAEEILLSTRQVSSATKYFQTVIKRDFNPYSPDCEEEYELDLQGSPDIPQLGLEDGYLKISKLN
jgi:hypothetical protein